MAAWCSGALIALASCSHDYRTARRILRQSPPHQLYPTFYPETPASAPLSSLRLTPLLPATPSALERQAAEEEAAIQILKKYRIP